MSDPLPERGYYLPELHDLAPHMAAGLDRLVEAFPAEARPHIAHLIVPNWQGREPLEAAEGFVARLRGLSGTPVLHGWTHSKGPEFWNGLLYGHDDRSEFARLDAAETADRVAKGCAMLQRVLGAVPRWFCAPRWAGNPHLSAALRGHGIDGVMHRRTLSRAGHPDRDLPALNFDEGARAFRIWPALGLRAVQIRRLLATRRPFRLVLHPDDLGRPAVFAQFSRLAAALEAEGWRPVGLDRLFPAKAPA